MSARPRLSGFFHQGRRSWGAVTERGIVDLGARFGGKWPDLRAVVEAAGLHEAGEAAERSSPDIGLDDVTFDIPIAKPEKIICVGVNYPDRNAEYRDGQEAPPNPSLFVRFPRSFVGHRVPLTRPTVSPQLDYEGEIAMVIGKTGRHVAESEALGHVAALTLCNEGTIRDWVRHAKFNVTQGKNFDGSGAVGPWIVPFENESQIADIELTTTVNGEVRQRDRTSRMIFPFAKLIAYVSTFTTLVPGDIIVTGTPTGAGARLDPPVWLRPGDVIEVSAEGIGTLVNGVVDEDLVR